MNKLVALSCWLIVVVLVGVPRAQAQVTSPPALVHIRGTVQEAVSQRRLPGATVRVQRTRRGMATDAQGDFLLTARPTDTLLIRALGYKPQQVLLLSEVGACAGTQMCCCSASCSGCCALLLLLRYAASASAFVGCDCQCHCCW